MKWPGKSLNIGEIRNCTVKENSVKQKYVYFRYVETSVENGVKAKGVELFPMKDFYAAVMLPSQLDEDETNFIQSFVFDTNKM